MKRVPFLLTFGALAIAGSLAALSQDIRRAFTQSQSFTKSVEVDRGRYYRLKVNLAYKGEPLVFDIVVGCNVRVTRYKDNDRTVEVGVAPFAYGLKMPDGYGIVVRPPEACGGETTENGRVPATLLPLVVTYENADQPWFGMGYASDDAYESPLSVLKFLGATISSATRPEWEAWRRTEAPKNFVTNQLLGISGGRLGENVRWQRGARFIGAQCQSFARVKLADAAREIVRAQWPSDKPTYWHPNNEASQALWPRPPAEAGRPEWLFENYLMKQYFAADTNFGLPRTAPGAQIRYTDRVAGAVYPARTDLTPNRLDPDGYLPKGVAWSQLSLAEAETRPELRGFAYCDSVDNIDGLPSFITPSLNKLVRRINGEVIQEYPRRADGLSESSHGFALERDEYVYFFRRYGLVNIFGGL
jgi:hypothetical protein